MNTEDFNEEVRRERIESDAAARTLEQEIEDLRDDMADLAKIIEDQAQTIVHLRTARQEERLELDTLRAEHKAAERVRDNAGKNAADFQAIYNAWADAHDRTELAK